MTDKTQVNPNELCRQCRNPFSEHAANDHSFDGSGWTVASLLVFHEAWEYYRGPDKTQVALQLAGPIIARIATMGHCDCKGTPLVHFTTDIVPKAQAALIAINEAKEFKSHQTLDLSQDQE